jgi:hypothetical protein
MSNAQTPPALLILEAFVKLLLFFLSFFVKSLSHKIRATFASTIFVHLCKACDILLTIPLAWEGIEDIPLRQIKIKQNLKSKLLRPVHNP